jgi:acyl-coenzyme A thioesterase 13
MATTKSAEHAHIEHLVATKLPQSPIYNFLLAPVRITHASKGLMLASPCPRTT